MHVLYCGADFEDVAAGAGDGRLFVVGMDLFFHTLTRFSYSYLMVEDIILKQGLKSKGGDLSRWWISGLLDVLSIS